MAKNFYCVFCLFGLLVIGKFFSIGGRKCINVINLRDVRISVAVSAIVRLSQVEILDMS